MFDSKITYLNSGNVIFESNTKQEILQKEIPKEWKNDSEQKTDVAYLFPEIDSKNIIDELPVNKKYINIRYVKGAIIWNVKKKEYNKSHLNKIISLKQYQLMTVRNVNTSRYLAGIK